MSGVIYSLCALTSLGCAWLLLRGYFRSRSRLLLWSGLCFAFWTISNLLLVVDRLIYHPGEEIFLLARLYISLAGMILLIYGLIWESE